MLRGLRTGAMVFLLLLTWLKAEPTVAALETGRRATSKPGPILRLHDLSLPPGAHIRGMELRGDGDQWDAIYMVSLRESAIATYTYFKRTQASLIKTDRGRSDSKGKGGYFHLTMRAPNGDIRTVLIYDRPGAEVSRVYGLTASEQRSALAVIAVTIPTRDVQGSGNRTVISVPMLR